MKGKIEITEMSRELINQVSSVYVAFTVYYENGETISATINFDKYYYVPSDLLVAIQKYVKGELQFK